MGRVGVGVGDMTKAVYDPNADGVIAEAQLFAAVCSETEAAALIAAALLYRSIGGDLSEELAFTGDCTNPDRLNDGLTDAYSGFTLNKYAQILFFDVIKINQFRLFKAILSSADDGEITIQYRNPVDGSWVNWVTGFIVPEDANEWMNWDSSGGTILCSGIKIICTKVDTTSGAVHIQEVEVKYA